jgi:hypothetical protein
MQTLPLFLKRLAWMALIWATSVLALGAAAMLIRLWLH